ncbi:hypothetical protein CKO33_12740 [Ectothiorhodospira mobilis]|nr:hypothetical protein [Ectothiorhodospira mobilis]
MPDRFNVVMTPALQAALPGLQSRAEDPQEAGRSYIRAIYVYLEHMEEQGMCGFSLLALLRSDAPDEVRLAVDEILEEVCLRVEREMPQYHLSENGDLPALAEREQSITIDQLGQYHKYNLDFVSLSRGDTDTGSKVPSP